MMFQEKRYGFWKVFWAVLGIYLLIGLLGVIAISITPVKKDMYEWRDFFSYPVLLKQCVTFVFIVFYYYVTLNSFYRLILHKKSTLHYVRACALTVAVLILFYVVSIQLFAAEKIHEVLTTGQLLFSYSLSTIFYVGVSLLIAYLTFLRDERKGRKLLEEQKMQLEVEKSIANFNFLKAQINPHFLHNTLNFLYAKSLPYAPELSEGILTLSDIMRYALSEGNSRDGKAPLKDEIEHVRNVIKINQLRFSNNLNVQLEVEGVVNGATIIPFVLITLVENAFKHGDLKSAEHPIRIWIKINREGLYFYCHNKKSNGTKELSTGIGLDNIRNRLDLAYGKNYALDIKDEDQFYTTQLTIRAT